VVISGRTHDDLAKRLDRLPLCHVFGHHGLESRAQSIDSAMQVREWVRYLRVRLVTHSGLVVEDKKYSVTVHYRRVRDKARVRKAIANAVRALSNARPLGGDQAVNLILRDGPDKGVALQKARSSLGCDTAIYVGDDDSDEDAFASAAPGHLLAIRVGSAKASRARYRLKTQADIDSLLSTLLTLRERRPPAARPLGRPW
jgi:trehalose 6-phosphate phosphatase